MRVDRSAPLTTASTTTPSRSSDPTSNSVAPAPPSPEKKFESTMIAPKSAIEPAATTSRPRSESISPASLSTGIRTPSDVDPRVMATSSGVSTRPPALSANATPTARASEHA